MKVAVLGAGSSASPAACYKRQQSHYTTIYDRRNVPGLEISFANAGQTSWRYAAARLLVHVVARPGSIAVQAGSGRDQ